MIWFYQPMESQVDCVAGDFVGKHACEITAKTRLLPLCSDLSLSLACSPTELSAVYTIPRSQRTLVGWRGNKCSTQGPIANDKIESQKFKSNWNTEHVERNRRIKRLRMATGRITLEKLVSFSNCNKIDISNLFIRCSRKNSCDSDTRIFTRYSHAATPAECNRP